MYCNISAVTPIAWPSPTIGWSPSSMAKSLFVGAIRLTTTNRKLLSLPVGEFLSRFLLHLLPQGFVRTRHYGFLATRRRAKLLPLCFELLGAAQQPPHEEHTCSTEDSPYLYRCPHCGGPMKVVERLTAAEIQLRSPPQSSAAA